MQHPSVEQKLWGRYIHSCAICDGWLYAHNNQTVLVVRGGDAAVKGVLLLARHAQKVTLEHRRTEFRASDKVAVRELR